MQAKWRTTSFCWWLHIQKACTIFRSHFNHTRSGSNIKLETSLSHKLRTLARTWVHLLFWIVQRSQFSFFPNVLPYIFDVLLMDWSNLALVGGQAWVRSGGSRELDNLILSAVVYVQYFMAFGRLFQKLSARHKIGDLACWNQFFARPVFLSGHLRRLF